MSLILNTLSLCELLMGHPNKDVTHYSMSKVAVLIISLCSHPRGSCWLRVPAAETNRIPMWCWQVVRGGQVELYPLSIRSFCLPSTPCPVFVSRWWWIHSTWFSQPILPRAPQFQSRSGQRTHFLDKIRSVATSFLCIAAMCFSEIWPHPLAPKMGPA